MMSTPTFGGPSNGHLSPDNQISMSFDTGDNVTDSDSPDVHDHTLDQPSPSPSDDANETSNMAQDDTHMSESEPSSEDNASEDGDFDMEESLPSQNDDAVEDRASSTDSNRASKRKVPIEEDEYIKANPELYGLRRSVRSEKFSPPSSWLTGTCRLDLENNVKSYVAIPNPSRGALLTQSRQVESDDSESEPPVSRRTVKRRRVESSRPCKHPLSPDSTRSWRLRLTRPSSFQDRYTDITSVNKRLRLRLRHIRRRSRQEPPEEGSAAA